MKKEQFIFKSAEETGKVPAPKSPFMERSVCGAVSKENKIGVVCNNMGQKDF